MAPTNDSTAPPTPTPPPAPSLADLYGPQGNLVAAPPTTPAGISQHQGAGGSWDEGSVPDESQRTQLENTGALPKARTTTQAASADIKKTGAVVQKVIDTPALKSVASQIPGYDEAMSAAHESAAWLKAHGHEKAANALSAYLGAESGADEFASALTSPKNMMMLYSLGKLKTAGAGGEVLDRLISAKFSYDSIKDAYDSVPGVQKAIDGGDYETAARLITNAAGGFALGVSAAHGAVSGVNGGEAPEADTIRQRAADAQSTTPVAGAGVPDEQSTLKIPKTEEAETTAVPGRVDLADLGGKELRGPTTFGRTGGRFSQAVNAAFDTARKTEAENAKSDVTVTSGQNGDMHEVKVQKNGEDIGSLYSYDNDDGTRSLRSSWVDDAHRGQGHGQTMILEAAKAAQDAGRTAYTSDPAGETSPDAARAWDSLVKKGLATKTGGEEGTAQYQIELNKPTVDLTDLGAIPITNGEGKPFTTGEPDAANELPVPANYKKNFENGFTWPNVRAHEAGHAITADSVGFGVGAMYSHLDPNGSAGGLASQQINYAGGDNPIQGAKEIPGSGGKYSLPLDSVRARLGDMLTALVGGGVAQEHIGGIPFDSNPGLVGDMQYAKNLMKALDIPDDQQSELLQSARDRAKTVLTHPAADGIIQKYTQTRAEGTPDALHMTADRVNDMVREHREARNGENGVSTQDNTAGHGEAVNRVGEKPVAGREGKGARGSDQSTQGRLSTTHEVNPKDDEDVKFLFGENAPKESANADNPESKRTPTSPESKRTPTNEAAESAQRYNTAKDQPQINHEAPPLNEGRAQALAAEMDTHAHEPNTPAVKKAYKSLISDVKEQWNHAQKDMGIKFEPSEKDPYTSYDEVKKDVEDNKHMSIYTGGNPLPEDHPLAQVDPKTGLTYNTMLRGVHDLYGHIAGNNDFSEQGEAGATNAHRQMMSPASVPALLNETEGQVSQYFHGKEKGGFPPQNATIVPENFVKDWHQEAGERAAKEEAGGIDPRTGTSATEGVGSEILPERRQALDHAPTPADFKAFYEANRDVLDKNPDLKVGWDNNSKVPGGHEINIGIVGDDAARLAKKLDQTSAFDIGKGEVIPTKGSGLRTEFSNYSLEERIKDAKGEPLSNVKDFEHLSKDFYDHLEPDEREYLKGNKLLQRNAMSQYHKIDPSVAETTNAMASGAALGGWWQRYMDVFHDLTGAQAQEAADHIGPAHSEILKQWHAAVSGNKSVEDANNLAWHSYADWLDAGKPTDRTSINNIVKQNAAQPEGSPKKGNAAISDTLDKNGKILSEGLDTSKLFKLVNSPEMRGERPFSNDAFNEKTPNALVAKTEGARKIPSMGATVAGKGNLNRLVIDAHIRDFYGYQNSSGPAAQYIADSVHLRQAAEALGLKGGEGQEQLWGTVLGLKQLLKTGLTPEDAAGKLNSDVINQIGKDYAEVIANDPEITKPGGLLDRLKEKYGVGSGSAGVGEANRKASASRAGQAESRSSQTPVDQAILSQTAQRILGQISESKIKKPAVAVPAEEVPVPKEAAPAPVVEDKYTAALKAGDAAAKAKRAANMKKGISGLSKPPQK